MRGVTTTRATAGQSMRTGTLTMTVSPAEGPPPWTSVAISAWSPAASAVTTPCRTCTAERGPTNRTDGESTCAPERVTPVILTSTSSPTRMVNSAGSATSFTTGSSSVWA